MKFGKKRKMKRKIGKEIKTKTLNLRMRLKKLYKKNSTERSGRKVGRNLEIFFPYIPKTTLQIAYHMTGFTFMIH